MKKKKIQLSILYTKKVSVKEESLGFEKECLIRRSPEQYALVIEDGIRYVIFEDIKECNGYTVVGRKMGGNKYKNYFMISFSIKEIKKVLAETSDSELNVEQLKKFLEIILKSCKENYKKFKTYVKVNYGIDYDNSAS